MTRRLILWQQVLVDALAEHPAVAVQTVVENHLERRASRTELSAARRAAHTLGRRGDAVLEHLPVPTRPGPPRLILTRPTGPAGGQREQPAEEPAGRSAVTRWADLRIDQPPPLRLGRWQQAVMDALDLHEVVGVRAVVEGHLGRRGTRAESTAAQRAARRLARSGQVHPAHVRVPGGKGRRGSELLIVARPGTDLAARTDPELQAAATRYLAPADRSNEALADVVADVERAAARTRDLDLYAVDPDAAGRAARALAVPLARLTQLRQSLLHRRSRS